ncbi:immunoglobulin superfamily member 5-like [Cyprinodon tularosa]|uniref:immunoglobulin superfamily member 5-like n=1 Tax=Cyprinodon tularosa TaxID=77115 RepID=UPI0018E25637|nr:immunoglobulin superfamily member 5-like [Cyprinodon tularosa]
MIASWKLWFGLVFICSLQCRVETQKLQVEPLDLAALRGSDVQFIANVEGSWDVMTWKVGKLLVLTIADDIIGSGRFNASFCYNDSRRCVEFKIYNVSHEDSGAVECELQSHGSLTAQLSVQESGTVSISGGNVTVAQGQQVTFECVTAGWIPAPNITWTQNDETVISSLYNSTIIADGDKFNSISVLNLTAVRNTKVECLANIAALKAPKSSPVFVTVVPKPADWTVLIAVVVSFGSCALLVLLILGIYHCYKQRKEKESNYQDEMRRVKTQSQLSVISADEQTSGQVNETYEPDNQDINIHVGAEPGFVKHRHVTIV